MTLFMSLYTSLLLNLWNLPDIDVSYPCPPPHPSPCPFPLVELITPLHTVAQFLEKPQTRNEFCWILGVSSFKVIELPWVICSKKSL